MQLGITLNRGDVDIDWCTLWWLQKNIRESYSVFLIVNLFLKWRWKVGSRENAIVSLTRKIHFELENAWKAFNLND